MARGREVSLSYTGRGRVENGKDDPVAQVSRCGRLGRHVCHHYFTPWLLHQRPRNMVFRNSYLYMITGMFLLVYSDWPVSELPVSESENYVFKDTLHVKYLAVLEHEYMYKLYGCCGAS